MRISLSRLLSVFKTDLAFWLDISFEKFGQKKMLWKEELAFLGKKAKNRTISQNLIFSSENPGKLLTKSLSRAKINKSSGSRMIQTEYGRVPEWPMGTDCKSAAFQLRWFESTRAHQELQYPNRVLEFLFCADFFGAWRVDENSIGRRPINTGKRNPP